MEISFPRVSPLADVALQGRFGADRGAPGVEFRVRHPLSIMTVIARKGKSSAVAGALAALKGATVQWAGPDQYFVLAEGRGEGALYREAKATLEDAYFVLKDFKPAADDRSAILSGASGEVRP